MAQVLVSAEYDYPCTVVTGSVRAKEQLALKCEHVAITELQVVEGIWLAWKTSIPCWTYQLLERALT